MRKEVTNEEIASTMVGGIKAGITIDIPFVKRKRGPTMLSRRLLLQRSLRGVGFLVNAEMVWDEDDRRFETQEKITEQNVIVDSTMILDGLIKLFPELNITYEVPEEVERTNGNERPGKGA